jgi:hypothetical protein
MCVKGWKGVKLIAEHVIEKKKSYFLPNIAQSPRSDLLIGPYCVYARWKKSVFIS